MERDKVVRAEHEQDKGGGRAIMQLVLEAGEGVVLVTVTAVVRAMVRVAVHFLVPLGRSMATLSRSWIGNRTVIPSR